MRSSADHIEQRGNAVQGVTDQQDDSFSIEFSLAVPLRVVSLDDPHPLVD